MFCKNISSCLLLKTIQEHFAIEITFTKLAGKVLCCQVHTDSTHLSVTPASKPLGSHWLSSLTSGGRTFVPVLLLFRFLISEITGLLMCLFKFKIHINILGRRKHVKHYQIPVVFMNKTNTRRVHTEVR